MTLSQGARVIERRDYSTRPFATKMQQDQARLWSTWTRVKAEREAKGLARISQIELAQKWKVTAPLIGHYLHAREPVPVKWQLRFAEYLGVPVTAIWPDFIHAKLLQSGLPSDALEVALEYLDLLPPSQQAIRLTIQNLPRRETKKRDAR